MLTISDAILEKNPMKYFRHIEQTGEDIVVTSNRKPILKIIPFKPEKQHPEEVFGDLRGRIKYYDDVLKPETDEWEV
jgi:antitoxin (DNA-binding transcriptional repressor) of toxin-antitoxin stability system